MYNHFCNLSVEEMLKTVDWNKVECLIKKAIRNDFIRMEVVPLHADIHIFVVTHGDYDWEDVCAQGRDYVSEYLESLGAYCCYIMFVDKEVKGGFLHDE